MNILQKQLMNPLFLMMKTWMIYLKKILFFF